jgi:hypothetical protein
LTVTLVKCSLPNAWKMDFPDLGSAVVELRSHICRSCLKGSEWDPPLDFEYEGVKFVCMNAMELLGTDCGVEYTLEGDHGLWPEDDDMDPNMDRHSKRKLSPGQQIETA